MNSPAGKKRSRLDGHVSKEEYEWALSHSSHTSSAGGGGFQRADAATLASRRMVKGTRRSKREKFINDLEFLNKTFEQWVEQRLTSAQDDGDDAILAADMTAGMQDYVTYIDKLEGRYMRKHGVVLTYGSGDCGQLALGEEEEDLEVMYPRVVFSLRDKKVAGIACGGLHNICFTEDGAVWTWGCNDDGALGRGGTENMPGQVTGGGIADDSIVGVAAGDVQSIAVGLSGAVYGFGAYKDKEGKQWFDPVHGQPAKTCKRMQTIPMKIPGLESIVEVACGASFNLALADDQTVYSWGIGEVGELGRPVCAMKTKMGPDGEEEYQFEKIRQTHLTPAPMLGVNGSPITGAKSIGCGAYHSLVITALYNRVMSCGLNNYGQLGHGDTTNLDRLKVITMLDGEGITSATGGMHHSLVFARVTGSIFAFGRSDSGQLGCVDATGPKREIPAGAFEDRPKEVILGGLDLNNMPKAIACGANHSMALTSAGGLYSWGYGDMLALGHGSAKDELRPKAVTFSPAKLGAVKVLMVDGGGQHTAIIADIMDRGGRM